MIDENIRFLEEYKELDKLIQDALNSEKGVSEYIERLTGHYEFSDEYHLLKRLRKIRNDLAHEPNTMNSDYATEDDIDDVKEFYNRIIDRKDPISLLTRKNSKRSKTKEKPSSILIVAIVIVLIYILMMLFM